MDGQQGDLTAACLRWYFEEGARSEWGCDGMGGILVVANMEAGE